MNDRLEISTFSLGYLLEVLQDKDVQAIYPFGSQIVLDEVKSILADRISDYN